MAANFLFDLVDPAELTSYAREFDDEVLKNQMGLEAWLPAVRNDNLEYEVTNSSRNDYDIAQYRAFDTPPRMAARQGFSKIRGKLLPVSRQIPLTEEENLRLHSLQTGKNNRLIKQIYDDVEHMVRSVQMRIEVARGQVLTTGKFTLTNENGLTMEADFGMPGGNKPTAGTAWSNIASDILADLLTWVQLYVDTNGVEPAHIVTSRTVLGYMYQNTKMLQAASFAGTTPTRLNNQMIDAIFAAHGLPPVTLYDTKYRNDGSQSSVIPTDKVLLLPPPGQCGETQYGITAEALVLQGKGYIAEEDMPGLVAVNLWNENPVQTFTLATALAVPILPDPKLVICADVIP